MFRIFILAALASLALGCTAPETPAPTPMMETCFKSGERSDGMSKLCFYKCTCGTKVLNVRGYDLCPLSHNFQCY